MTTRNVNVYFNEIIGVPGKGPNWIEPYNGDTTIGDIIRKMTDNKLGERNKRIEILKHERGYLGRFDKQNLWWSYDTKLRDYISAMGHGRPDVMMVYYIV